MITFLIIITFFFVLFIVLIKPNRRRIETLPTGMYAHRGLHDGITAAENSLTAFRLAAENNYGAELDVQLTKDKQLVVFHDDTLKRVCGADTKIAQHTYEELKQYRLLNTDDTIPLFSDVLKTMQALPIICEIKHPEGAANVEICPYVAEAIEGYEGNICIESFSPFSVMWFKKNRPEVIRGQLSSAFKGSAKMPFIEKFAARNLLFNIFASPDFIAYHFTDDSAGFKLCRELFNPVCVAWTARGKEEIKNAQAQKRFDVIIFEERANDGSYTD